MKKSLRMHLYILFIMLVTSCSSVKCLPDIVVHDSVRLEYKLDSVYLYERDSIYLDRSRDTVLKEVYHWRWRDKIVVQRDSIYLDRDVVQTQTVKYIPAFYKWCTGLFFALVVICIGWTALKIYLRIK